MLKLTLPEVKKEPKETERCPICKGRRLIRHRTIFKPVKDSILKEVTIRRMLRKNCHYTFRIYPEGVNEGSARTKRLIFLGVVLYLAGLSYEKCEWFLEGILGRKLVDMVTIWRDIQRLGKKLRGKNLPPNVGLIVGIDGTCFKVKVVPTIFATDAKRGSLSGSTSGTSVVMNSRGAQIPALILPPISSGQMWTKTRQAGWPGHLLLQVALRLEGFPAAP